MSDPKSEQDPSMEEILSSIRRIISDEGEEGAETAVPDDDMASKEADAGDTEPEEIPTDDGDDVLELTEVVNEDGSVTSLADADAPEDGADAPEDGAPEEDAPEEEVSEDGAPEEDAPEEDVPEDDAPEDEEDLSVAFEEDEEDAEEAEAEPATEPVADAAPAPALEADEPPAVAEGLVSSDTEVASTGAFAALSKTLAAKSAEGSLSLDASGRTLEDLVKELLRPMLKEWLDDNLPALTERLVQREIQRMAGQAEDD